MAGEIRFSVSRHGIWTQIRFFGHRDAAFTVAKLGARCRRLNPVPPEDWAVQDYLNFLCAHGYVTRLPGGGGIEAYQYQLVLAKNSGLCAPVPVGNGRVYDPNRAGPVLYRHQRLWNALRLAGGQTAQQLCVAAAPFNVTAARHYLLALERAGLARGTQYGRRLKTWRFCGAMTPYFMPLVGDQLFDQVKNQFFEVKNV